MKEIERKFLLKDTQFSQISSIGQCPLIFVGVITQGYVVVKDKVTLRVRTCLLKNWKQAFLTVKGILGDNSIERIEEEIMIDPELADNLLEGVEVLTKTRYIYGEYIIDVYHDDLEGLFVAEREYDTIEEANSDTVPSWVYSEVTNNRQYLNHNLIGKKFVNGIIA